MVRTRETIQRTMSRLAGDDGKEIVTHTTTRYNRGMEKANTQQRAAAETEATVCTGSPKLDSRRLENAAWSDFRWSAQNLA